METPFWSCHSSNWIEQIQVFYNLALVKLTAIEASAWTELRKREREEERKKTKKEREGEREEGRKEILQSKQHPCNISLVDM